MPNLAAETAQAGVDDQTGWLSVVVLTHNEEVNLPGCLQSLDGLRCDIHVVDSGSTDRTLEIARSHGATVVTHPFDNYAAQRNWTLVHLGLDSEWVLNLDADERLTPELVLEINGVLSGNPNGTKGFLLRKRTIFMGRWIKHGGHYPSYHLRLFRRQHGRCEDKLYDQHFLVDGPVRRLEHDYIDVVTSDISTWTIRHTRWANLEALELLRTASGSRVRPLLFGSPVERKRWFRDRIYATFPLYVRPFLYWMYRYFIRLGFLDGCEGFLFHFLQAWWYRVLIDINIQTLKTNGYQKENLRT